MEKTILELKSISKSFGANRALINIDLSLQQGDVMSIVGENGAGKSTLMMIIAGVLQPDGGTIEFDGEQIRLRSPLDAVKKGISIVFQEPNIFSNLSVVENIFSNQKIKKKSGLLDWEAMYTEAVGALARVGVPKEVAGMAMKQLSIGTQQLVLIAKGIYQKCKLLILDEPTSILSGAEAEKLFSIIAELKKNGISVLYISHRIAEVLKISDKVVVLRDGQITEQMNPKEATEQRIITAMSGREINTDVYRQRDYKDKAPILEVKNLSSGSAYRDVSFSVRPGEILGIYGLVGAGRSEVAQTIFGLRKSDGGEIVFEGRQIENKNPKQAVGRKIFYLPEDRRTEGLFVLHSIQDNMSVSILDRLSGRLGFLRRREEGRTVREHIEKYKVKTQGPNFNVMSLSGGGQQKVLVCRWLMEKPKVIVLDEPTRGIDVATKAEIHEYIMQLGQEGIATILISSDLPEVMSLSDRVIVMYKGTIKDCLEKTDATEEKILRYAIGL